MEVTDNVIANENKDKQPQQPSQTQPTNQLIVDQLMMGIYDICSKIDINVGIVLNAITNINNTKNDYLKLLGQLRQERQSIMNATMGDSISSK